MRQKILFTMLILFWGIVSAVTAQQDLTPILQSLLMLQKQLIVKMVILDFLQVLMLCSKEIGWGKGVVDITNYYKWRV